MNELLLNNPYKLPSFLQDNSQYSYDTSPGMLFMLNSIGFLAFMGILMDVFYLYEAKISYLDYQTTLSQYFQGVDIYLSYTYFEMTAIMYMPWIVFIHLPLNVILLVTTTDYSITPANWEVIKFLLTVIEIISGMIHMTLLFSVIMIYLGTIIATFYWEW